MQPGRARTSGLRVPPLLRTQWVSWVAPVRLTHGVLVLSCPSAALRVQVCAVSWATWLLFTGVPTRCVVLRVRCPGPLGSRSPVCPLGVLCCVCGVLGHLAPVHRCARWVRCFASVVSWATWVLFTGAPARCVDLLVRCRAPLGSCSPMCPLGVLCCVCGVLGHLTPVHRCASSVCCVASAVSWETWLLFTDVPAWFVVLRLRCPGPLGSCSPVRPLHALLCWCGVLGHLAPVHWCARSMCCVACAVSWATWLLFTGVPAWFVVLRVQCPGPLGSCSPVRPLSALLCWCGVLAHLAPVHRCACWVCSVACVVSWATWLPFTGVRTLFFALLLRCPGPLRSSSPVCLRGVLCCACGVLGHSAPVHRCARSVCCVACAVSWATWLLFTGVPARRVVLRVRCPGPLGCCSPVCALCPLLCSCGVLGHLAPVHRCARSVCCVVCAVSWATWPLFTGVPSLCVVVRVRCRGPLGSCSPVCPLGVLCCVYGVLGPLALVHRCARSVCCVGCAWLGRLGSCSPMCSAGVLCCVLRVRCCLCGASLRGGHSSIRTAAVRSRQGLAILRARTRPSGRRLFCSRQGLVTLPGAHLSIRTAAVRSRQGLGTLRARAHPSGRRLFHSWQGLAWLPGAHTSVRMAAGVAWHLFSCRGSLRVVRALRVCGTRRPLLLRTCPYALVVAGGMPLWCASCPLVVHHASSGTVAVRFPVGFPDAVVPFPTPGACAPGFTGWLRGACGGWPRTRLIVPAAGPRRGRGAGLAPRRTRSWPRDGVVTGGSLRCRSWAACAALVGVCGPSH